MPASVISWRGVMLRIVLALLLVLATFNPSGWSALHWLTAPPTEITATKAFVAVVLLIAWIALLRTAFVSLGLLGLVLGAALLGTFAWMLVSFGWLTLGSVNAMAWLVLVILGLLLGLGLSWSLLRARATGQVEVQ